jgi:hypothetical protein
MFEVRAGQHRRFGGGVLSPGDDRRNSSGWPPRTANLEARHQAKTQQLLANPYGTDGYVVVVGFAARKVIFTFHRNDRGGSVSENSLGIDRHGLDASFDADEVLKSNLIVEAQFLTAQQQPDAAADRFAQAAEIEERLSSRCADQGLREKSWVHLFSAVSCWARAGEFHTAIGLGEQLLAEPGLPPRLRQRIHELTSTIRTRRTQWAAGLVLAASGD